MRTLIVTTIAITTIFAASIPKTYHTEPHRVDKKDSIEQEISEALKDINASRHLIHMNMKVNDTDNELPASFFRDIEDAFSGMFEAIQNTNVPFFSHEPISSVNETANQTTQDLLTRTRNELKEDIDILQSRISHIRSDINEWVISNEHQDLRSMLIGGLSAVVVLCCYYFLCKCCRRRSRLNHLSAFVNEGFSGNQGDTDSLLPTTKNSKRGRHFPSNSDEDI
ncbi:Protein CBG14962 [Caenorhabditis briggsae]|uniref:Uncharacterized protein n=3 Tax=Caenorhabditis briggsae TaxID=6238 RepID=A0AAE9J210_CAEBR|nr:Protein CBG14962 [Caenorhabditis briggsae]ULU10119.1 hypothetical protein L3Y34_014444 [Caenorhabditis briggsae]UMM11049.1 hypothetical protein L5515_000525 [Caenorhabditis briggsae]CAP33363.1 Protein CBG14962 [Caenorhabditis briggsae]